MMNLMVRSLSGRYRRAGKEEVLEVAAQYLAASLQRSVSRPLTSPSAVEQFLVQALAPRDAEVFCAMFLDNRHRLIQFDELFRGTVDGSSVQIVEADEQIRRLTTARVEDAVSELNTDRATIADVEEQARAQRRRRFLGL